MKAKILLSFVLLGSLDVSAHATSVRTDLLPKEIQKSKHQPLTMSYLAKGMVNSFSNNSVQIHASGHLVYDRQIVLKDKNGHKIRFRDEYSSKKIYALDKIANEETIVKDVWFFSPNGSALPDSVDDPQNYCTYERPCSNVTQDLIDKMHQVKIQGSLWFATGDYQMPNHARQHDSKVLFLYNGFEVRGRTSDFYFNPEANERPLIEGTLAWNDLGGHYGGIGYVSHIKSRIKDNLLYLKDYSESVNLYSNGWIELKSVEAIQEQGDIIVYGTQGSNVYADRTYISNSSLLNKRFGAINVKAQTAIIESSSLTADGYNASNIHPDYSVSSTYDDFYGISIYESDIKLSNACWGQMIATRHVSYLLLINSTLEANAADNSSYSECQLRAIDSDAAKIKRSYEIINSKIEVNNSHGDAIGIIGYDEDYHISKSQISLKAQGGFSFLMRAKSVTFNEAPSYLSISSDQRSRLWDVELLSNQSTPPSQCKVDDEASQDC